MASIAQEGPGHVGLAPAGGPISWSNSKNSSFEKDVVTDSCGVFPLDEHNALLLDCVHPLEWVDASRDADFVYDLIAVGAGAGGLVSAKQAARRGAKSALIESHLAGGDCLNVGCVPSKALIRCARAAREAARGAEFGLTADKQGVDFGIVMERMRRLRATIAPADAHTATTSVGADVYQGRAVFTGRNELEVNGKKLKFKKAVVATGGTASLPNIPGLAEVPYRTNETLFNLTKLPKRMIIIGGGPIGLEMAQAFACFGCKVTVLLRSTDLLPREDPDAARVVHDALTKDGVNFVFGVNYKSVSCSKGIVTVKCDTSHECETLLVATGRKPNVEGIGLEAAGVDFNDHGVLINDILQTSNPDIYAVGDVCSPYKFTHVAGAMAGLAVSNSLFGENIQFSKMSIPWTTFTHPEVAHVGLYERDFEKKGLKCETYTSALSDRAILESEGPGFVKVHCLAGTDVILGATIVADHAGEMISELTVAIQAKVGLGTIGKIIHPYPTVAEAIQGCGVAYNRTKWTTMSTKKTSPIKTLLEKICSMATPQLALGIIVGAAAALAATRSRSS